jgi:hypothetical protein
MISSLINKFKTQPRRIFLFDGLGAVITILFLRIILVQLNDLVGIPISTLTILASLPMAFILIDVVGYVFFERIGPLVLKLIMTLNISYCFLSLYFGWLDFASITWLGWTYLMIEILIIVGVVLLENRVLKIIVKS